MIRLLAAILSTTILAAAAWAAPPTLTPTFETQIRMIADLEPPADASAEAGVQVRRARLVLDAARPDGGLSGRLRLACGCGGSSADIDLCYVDVGPGGAWTLRLGQFKPRFLFEELVSSSRQIAAERTYAADYFTVDISQGAALTWRGGRWRCDAAVHDGAYAAGTDFHLDGRDLAACTRVRCAFVGEPTSTHRPVAGSRPALQLGLGFDHEGGPAASADRATVDAVLRTGRLSAFVAAVVQDLHENADLPEARQTGLTAQAAVALDTRLDGFLRWERIGWDGVYHRAARGGVQAGGGPTACDRLRIWTAGVNWYRNGQAERWTLDVLRAEDPVPTANTGTGLRADAGGGQTVVRLQYQATFR